jgi:hypothetical protein
MCWPGLQGLGASVGRWEGGVNRRIMVRTPAAATQSASFPTEVKDVVARAVLGLK